MQLKSIAVRLSSSLPFDVSWYFNRPGYALVVVILGLGWNTPPPPDPHSTVSCTKLVRLHVSNVCVCVCVCVCVRVRARVCVRAYVHACARVFSDRSNNLAIFTWILDRLANPRLLLCEYRRLYTYLNNQFHIFLTKCRWHSGRNLHFPNELLFFSKQHLHCLNNASAENFV